MTPETSRNLIESLDAILEQERSALLAGDLSSLPTLALEKEGLVAGLNGLAPCPLDDLRAIHDKLIRNQRLLDGALHGIRAVAARLAAHRRVRRTLDTYDQHGRKQTIVGEITHHLEKRA
ncbi:MAG: flagellar protein FlgN [Roseovarius sp.]